MGNLQFGIAHGENGKAGNDVRNAEGKALLFHN